VDRLTLTIGDRNFDVDIIDASSETIRCLVALLPWESDAHYAKVAGEEIIAGVPLLLPFENPTQVAGIEAGSFGYWPDRAVLCCYYGVSTEVEAVTVIGRITHDLGGLRVAGDSVRAAQGGRFRLEVGN
jgi:hypothetical protein